MSENTNLIAGLFTVVAAEDIPTKIRRSRGNSDWAVAIRALSELEVGRGLSLQVPKPDVNRTRQNMLQANNSHGNGMVVRTRTRPVLNKAGEPVLNEDNEPLIEIYFIKEADAPVTSDAE